MREAAEGKPVEIGRLQRYATDAAMARGAVIKAKASVALAITGVTGDKPDEDGNPIGLVYCAAARADGGVKTVQLALRQDKPPVLIEQTLEAALSLLRDFIFV